MAAGVGVDKQSEYILPPTGLRALDGCPLGKRGSGGFLLVYSSNIRSNVYYTTLSVRVRANINRRLQIKSVRTKCENEKGEPATCTREVKTLRTGLSYFHHGIGGDPANEPVDPASEHNHMSPPGQFLAN